MKAMCPGSITVSFTGITNAPEQYGDLNKTFTVKFSPTHLVDPGHCLYVLSGSGKFPYPAIFVNMLNGAMSVVLYQMVSDIGADIVFSAYDQNPNNTLVYGGTVSIT